MEAVHEERFLLGFAVIPQHPLGNVHVGQPFVLLALRLDQRVGLLDLVPKVPAPHARLDGEEDHLSLGQLLVDSLDKGLEVGSQLLGGFTLDDVVVPTIENDQARRVLCDDSRCEVDRVNDL